ncbi:MAG: methionyl-tRNA formyltransferase, partial [Opitutaceae bacterium]
GELVKLGLADPVASPGFAGVPPATNERSPPEAPAPGKILGADPDGLLVANGRGVLRLRKLQRPGGRMLSAAEFLRGFSIETGTQLPSHPMSQLVTTR